MKKKIIKCLKSKLLLEKNKNLKSFSASAIVVITG